MSDTTILHQTDSLGMSDTSPFLVSSVNSGIELRDQVISEGTAEKSARLNVVHRVKMDDDGIVHLPVGTSVDEISVDGSDILLKQPDGASFIIEGGMLNVPTIFTGDVEIPKHVLSAVLQDGSIEPTAPPVPESVGAVGIGVESYRTGSVGDVLKMNELLGDSHTSDSSGLPTGELPGSGSTSTAMGHDDGPRVITSSSVPNSDGTGDVPYILPGSGSTVLGSPANQPVELLLEVAGSGSGSVPVPGPGPVPVPDPDHFSLRDTISHLQGTSDGIEVIRWEMEESAKDITVIHAYNSPDDGICGLSSPVSTPATYDVSMTDASGHSNLEVGTLVMHAIGDQANSVQTKTTTLITRDGIKVIASTSVQASDDSTGSDSCGMTPEVAAKVLYNDDGSPYVLVTTSIVPNEDVMLAPGNNGVINTAHSEQWFPNTGFRVMKAVIDNTNVELVSEHVEDFMPGELPGSDSVLITTDHDIFPYEAGDSTIGDLVIKSTISGGDIGFMPGIAPYSYGLEEADSSMTTYHLVG